MSTTHIPNLRNTTRHPKTGKITPRNRINHLPVLTPTKAKAKDPLDKPPSSQSSHKQNPNANMPVAETQTDTGHPQRDEELHRKLDNLAERFDTVEKTNVDYKASLEFTQAEVLELKEENDTLKESLIELSLEIQRNTYAIQNLTAKHTNLESNTKKRNLIFEGIPEQQPGSRENLHERICALFSEMGIVKPIDYDMAYRIGSIPGKNPRPILISFIRQDDRNLIYAARTQLRKSRNFQRVWVSEDVPPQTRRTRNVIREVAREARSQGARCQVTPTSVTINNRKYTEANLVDLPPELAVEKIKMKKIGDTIAYNSEHAPFSNLYPASVPFGKHVHLSSEQAFRHTRAKENNHHNVAARILWTRDPYEMMDLDRNLPVTEEWKQKEDFVLFKCMFRKFEANEELRDTLTSTGDLELAEATRSMKWATGASLNSTAMKNHTWTGGNKQGKHTMKIRDYLRDNYEKYTPGVLTEPVSDKILRELYESE